MHSRFGTGSMPGIAASTRLTCVLGSAPNAVAAPEKSLALRGDLRVDFEADDDLPFAGFAAHSERRSSISHLPPFLRSCREAGPFLDRKPRVQHHLLVELVADEMQAERQPCSSRPHGTLIAGSPARLAGTAKTSFKYIASGSVVSPIPNAADGAVGRKDQVALIESFGEIPLDQRAHLLGFREISVVKACG